MCHLRRPQTPRMPRGPRSNSQNKYLARRRTPRKVPLPSAELIALTEARVRMAAAVVLASKQGNQTIAPRTTIISCRLVTLHVDLGQRSLRMWLALGAPTISLEGRRWPIRSGRSPCTSQTTQLSRLTIALMAAMQVTTSFTWRLIERWRRKLRSKSKMAKKQYPSGSWSEKRS